MCVPVGRNDPCYAYLVYDGRTYLCTYCKDPSARVVTELMDYQMLSTYVTNNNITVTKENLKTLSIFVKDKLVMSLMKVLSSELYTKRNNHYGRGWNANG